MQEMNKMITVFTPTYNRAYILPKLYDSLLSQTNKAFKWMIVDDGSDDGTKELVDLWKSENKIEIGYIYQKNRGKAMAHTAAMEHIDTELVCICDSDDVLTERAIEFIEKCWKEGGYGRPEIAGIVAYMKEKSEESIPEEKELPKMKSQKLYEIFRGGVGLLLYFLGLTKGIWFYIIALAGIFAAMMISILLQNVKLLQLLGRNTLAIMVMHGPFYRVVIFVSALLLHTSTEQLRESFLVSVLFSIFVICFLGIPIIILNKYLPWMIGKKKVSSKT